MVHNSNASVTKKRHIFRAKRIIHSLASQTLGQDGAEHDGAIARKEQLKSDQIQFKAIRTPEVKNQMFSMNFEDIKSIDDLQRVSKEVVWQNFEKLAAFIFEENDFLTKTNTVKTSNKKRRQYDIIAKKYNKVFLIECKKWSGNRYRLSALKTATKQHKERTEFYQNLTKENAVPIIVTLIEEEIKLYDGIPIVPISKLNSYINELDKDANEDSCPGDEATNLHE